MDRPFSLLVCAMGGEGGGVLTGWIVAAARTAGLAVQATSVPGVAQRSGATSYYIELARRDGQGRAPVFCLYPVAGQVDAVLASELLEAARAAASGFVTPDRTTVLASSHRVYSMTEKTAPGDGRIDPAALREAVTDRARQLILQDMDSLAREHSVPISAVMLGALAGADTTPIPRQAFEDAIRSDGRSVERNLAAFAAAFDRVSGRPVDEGAGATAAPTPARPDSADDTLGALPDSAREVARLGIERLIDYQGRGYARLYLERLLPFASGDPDLCREIARHLALRMAYEDVMRVAQLKIRPDRAARIRDELGLEGDDPFHVVEFLKPGVAEICDALPAVLARPLLALAARYPAFARCHVGMRLRSTTVWGCLRLLLLARMRLIRRMTYRYGVEQKSIERWLALVARAAEQDAGLAREVAALSGLVKGYADTAGRSRESLERILSDLVEPILDRRIVPADPAAAIAGARRAALTEPPEKAIDAYLAPLTA